MKKRIFSLTIIANLVLVLSLTACGQTGEQTSEIMGEAPTLHKDEHTLFVTAWDKNFNEPALEAAGADYREHVDPDFKLVIAMVDESEDIQSQMTLAGEMDDYSDLTDLILFQDHAFQHYITEYPEAWVDLSDCDIDWDDFSQEKLSYSTYDGVHYGAPVDNGTVIAAYRTDCLAAAGYTIDDLTGCTWDQFIEIGSAVYQKTGKYLLSIDGNANDLFYIMLQEEGVSAFKDGKPYITDNETLFEVMDILNRMLQTNTLYLAENYRDYTDNVIGGDLAAGVINGNWIIPTIESVEENAGLWEITTLPTIKGGEGYATNGGASIYITKNCHNVDLAKDFLSYTFGGSTETYDRALEEAGLVTTCISAGQSEVYDQGIPYFNDQPIYRQIVEYSTHVQIVEQNSFHYNCRDELGYALVNVNQGGYTIEDALKEANLNLTETMGL